VSDPPPAIGIDLGTTYSALALLGDAGVELIPNADRELLTPSVVEVSPDGALTVGSVAKRNAALDPDRVLALFKRQMGTDASYLIDGRRLTPVDLSAAVLAQLCSDATSATGLPVKEATITVPAYFGDDARLATRQAAAQAGIEVRDLVHEPTAAAVAFGFGVGGGAGGPAMVLVYDLGGGTFDVSIVRWDMAEMTVLSTCGDHHLGGANWDAELSAIVSEAFESRHGVDPRDELQTGAELQERAESAKRALSRLQSTAVMVVCGSARDRVEVTRSEFEERTRHLLAQTESLLAQALQDAGLSPEDLDAALLVGGSTRMPMCAEAVQRATGLAPAKGLDPDQAVARGAAILAGVRQPGRDSIRTSSRPGSITRLPEVRDVTPHALGFVVISADGTRYVNDVMIPRNTPIPVEEHKLRRLETRKGQAAHLRVYLLQGDAERPLDATPLGSWSFNDVPHGKGDHVDLDIAFRYDRDGVVEIAALLEGRSLAAPEVDREDRDISWSDEDPREHSSVEPVTVVLAIDCSGSMEGASIQEARRACLGFADELSTHPDCKIALVSFASGATTEVRLQPAHSTLTGAVKRLSTGGSTDMAAGLETAAGLLEGLSGRRAVVLLTDGYPDDDQATRAAAGRLAAAGVEVHPRGVQGADESFLRSLASSDGELMTDLDGLTGSFRGIARQLADNSGLRRA
jgi:molecular chaperone DnaK